MRVISRELLQNAARRLAEAGVETPLLDAQLLLAHVLHCSRLDLIAHPERSLTEAELREFNVVLGRRSAREPLAYILGHKEFYGLEIDVAPGVLIPRPETELLVEECTRRLTRSSPVIADIGTGSGAVAVALAASIPSAAVYATELSPAALEVARRNVEKHDLSGRVTLVRGDLVEPLAGMSFDAIVSNPPYIPTGEIESLQPEIRLHEPIEALDGGPDGLGVYRRLIPAAKPLLLEGGFLAVEVGSGQAGAVGGIAQGAGYGEIVIARDLAGIERVVVACR